MSSTGGINKQTQTDPALDPASPDYWETPGLDGLTGESALSPEEEARLTKKKDELNQLLLRMSASNNGRAKIQKELDDIDAQLAAGDLSSDWGEDEEEGPAPVNPNSPEDTTPVSIKENEATYQGAAGDSITIHSNPGNKVNKYTIKFDSTDATSPNSLLLSLESKNDTAKVECKDGQYLIHVKNLKGKEETYTVSADNIGKINLLNTADDKIDISSLTPAQAAKIQINNESPKWADQLLANIPTYTMTNKSDHNLQTANLLANQIIASAKSGDWKNVTTFLTTDPIMLKPDEANDVIRKILGALVEPILSKEIEKVDAPLRAYVGNGNYGNEINPRDDTSSARGVAIFWNVIAPGWVGVSSGEGSKVGDLGYMNWEHYYNYERANRDKIGNDPALVKRVGIEFYADKLPAELKTQIIETLKILPKEVRQQMLASLTSEDSEKWMGDRFSTADWRSLLNASITGDTSSSSSSETKTTSTAATE